LADIGFLLLKFILVGTALLLVTKGLNAREEIRNILFGVFSLNGIRKPNPSKALSYFVAQHIFDKNTKRVLFLWEFVD